MYQMLNSTKGVYIPAVVKAFKGQSPPMQSRRKPRSPCSFPLTMSLLPSNPPTHPERRVGRTRENLSYGKCEAD
ncbi:hypothetical protein B9Z19DRAFT_1075383 [Tuber borchii]|uniref:Uncharacterized protein n=1 Tax=Tuber borchii TaxID=42251 RepID=A0A2T7A3G0_TUBBO|nr:hypothetical protein B9Z19DRAFT_1075383 [Tuber borchii]